MLPLLESPDSPPGVEDDPYMVEMAVDSVAAMPERIEDSVFNEVVGTFSSYKTGDAPTELDSQSTELDSQSTELDSDSPVDIEPPAPKRRRVTWLEPVVAQLVSIERMYMQPKYITIQRKVRRRDVYRPPVYRARGRARSRGFSMSAGSAEHDVFDW